VDSLPIVFFAEYKVLRLGLFFAEGIGDDVGLNDRRLQPERSWRRLPLR
jgi:hypothetical protein